MPRLPNRQERARISARLRAEAWRVAEREAAEQEAAEQEAAQAKHDRQRRELDHLRTFEAAVGDAIRMAFDGHILAYEVAARVTDALTALDAARAAHTTTDQEPPMAVTPARDPWAENAALRARVAELEDVALDLNTSLGRSDRDRDAAQARAYRAERDRRASLDRETRQPHPIDLIHELRTVLHGRSVATNETPQEAWAATKADVRAVVARVAELEASRRELELTAGANLDGAAQALAELQRDHDATRSALRGLAVAAELHAAACGCGSYGEVEATKQALERAVTGAHVRLGDLTVIGHAIQTDDTDQPAPEPIDPIAEDHQARQATTVDTGGAL